MVAYAGLDASRLREYRLKYVFWRDMSSWEHQMTEDADVQAAPRIQAASAVDTGGRLMVTKYRGWVDADEARAPVGEEDLVARTRAAIHAADHLGRADVVRLDRSQRLVQGTNSTVDHYAAAQYCRRHPAE